MITPSFGLTATERVLPKLTLDWTTGNVQSGVDVARSGVATFVGSNGLIQSAVADTQRIDYSTGIAGLLVEESRTNLHLYSEALETTPTWVRDNCSVTGNVAGVNAPDGAETVSKFIPNLGSLSNSRLRQNTAYSAQKYTHSLFVKQADSSFLYYVNASAAVFNPPPLVYVDLADGTVLQSTNAVTSVVAFDNGWYKISVTPNANATATTSTLGMLPGAADAVGSGAVTGDGVKGLYFWGSQLEAGAFPTSYIPTEATAVTRNADIATMTGTNFSDWYNPTEGTFRISASLIKAAATTNRGLFRAFNFSDTGQRIMAYANTSGSPTMQVVSTTTQAQVSSGTIIDNTLFNFCCGFKLDNFGAAKDGLTVATDLTGTIPTGIDTMNLGLDASATTYLNGWLNKISFYPQKLITAEIQAFSKG